MKKIIWVIAILLLMVGLIYAIGPRPKYAQFDPEPISVIPAMDQLEALLTEQNQDPRIRPGTAAKIIWQDSFRQTPYSLVYMHGFSATHPEGSPIHTQIAERYGMNLYLTRFPDHGLADSNSFRDIDPYEWIRYGKEAIAIGKSIGKKVIIMSTSTGSTISIFLTAHDPSIAGQILLSPNIDLYDQNSRLLTKPWGFQLGKIVLGSEYRRINGPDSVQKYWTMQYHIDGLVALRSLLDRTMDPKTFHKIETPVFLGYYYKDEEHMDKVVSVQAMQDFMENLKISNDQQYMVAFPEAGNHVIGSKYWNPNWPRVEAEIMRFIDQAIGIPTKSSTHAAEESHTF